ncbi:unnamed protein product [Schistosoma mattheei]|uniref:Rho-GAP domain-containing protein n=3 Tax=Schistosoma mattheei TaxID=31246 RepID=A0AA85BBX2_9TREM|nr:unnamed protein product [Schistosoma mattheei]
MNFEFKRTSDIPTLSNKETESKFKKKHENITIPKQEFSSPLDGDNDNGKQFKLFRNSTEVKSSSSHSLESLNTMKISKVSVNRQFSIPDAPIPLKFTPVNVDLLPLDLLSDSQNKTIHELLSHNESFTESEQIKLLNNEDYMDIKETTNKIRSHLDYLHKHESQHLKILEEIKTSLDFIKQKRTTNEVITIRSSVNSIETIQKNFIHGLKICLQNGDINYKNFLDPFKLLINRQIEISNYVSKISKLLKNLKPEKSDTLDSKSLNSFRLQEPTTWITQTVENIKTLVLLLDTDSPHYPELQRIYKRLLEESLNSNNSIEDKTINDSNRLIMHSLVVELTSKTNSRKLRYLFLFKDVLICAKIKFTMGSRQRILHENSSLSESRFRRKRSGKFSASSYELEIKWFISMEEMSLLSNSRVGSDDRGRLQNQKNLDELKGMVRNLRQTMSRSLEDKHSSKNTSKLTSLIKLEGKLVLETPQLILPIADKSERTHWRSALEQVLDKPPHNTDKFYSLRRTTPEKMSTDYFHSPSRSRSSSIGDFSERLKKYKHMVKLNGVGLSIIDKDEPITGYIKATVHGIDGLNEKNSYHVRIEVDSYGQYEEVACTRVLQQSNPQWEQSFDLEVDGAWTICFTLYIHQEMFAELDVPLDLETLKTNSRIDMKILTNENPPRSLTFSVSLEYVDQVNLNKNRRSEIRGNLFGRHLAELIRVPNDIDKNECTKKHKSEAFIPRFVIACVEEIERRGLLAVGLYRLCGSNDNIKALKSEFDESCTLAIQRLPLVELPVITSLLKQFFQHLPESLVDYTATIALLQAVEIPDESVRCQLIEDILVNLPTPNLETFNYLANHLVTVSNYKAQNKMDLGNLSLIWSYTLFECSSKTIPSTEMNEQTKSGSSSKSNTAEIQVAFSFQQAKVLNCILTSMKSGKLTIPSHSNVIRPVYS